MKALLALLVTLGLAAATPLRRTDTTTTDSGCTNGTQPDPLDVCIKPVPGNCNFHYCYVPPCLQRCCRECGRTHWLAAPGLG